MLCPYGAGALIEEIFMNDLNLTPQAGEERVG
jgi:hypothetical protein